MPNRAAATSAERRWNGMKKKDRRRSSVNATATAVYGINTGGGAGDKNIMFSTLKRRSVFRRNNHIM